MPIPIIGNFVTKEIFTKAGRYFRKMRDIYGGIFVLWGLTTPIIFVMDPKLAREVFTKTEIYAKGPAFDRVFAAAFGNGLVTSYGAKYRKDKALLSRFFQRKNILKHLPVFVEETHKLINDVFMKGENGQVYDFSYFFLVLTLRCFTRFSMNYDITKDLAETRDPRDMDELFTGTSYVSQVIGTAMHFYLPVSRYLNPFFGYLYDNIKRLHLFYDEVIAKRRKLEKEGVFHDDVLSAVLGANFDTYSLMSHLVTLMITGHDTTGYFEVYTAYLLAKHPDIQKRVKAEIKQVLNGRDTVTAEDLSNLKYLSCVLRESLRLYSIIPQVPRENRVDTELGGYKIPAGTKLIICVANMNKVEDVWENPHEFNPDRFNNITSEQSTKHGYFPFGYGQRSCLGSTLAITEATVAFALMLQKITFEPVDNFTPESARFAVTLMNTNGMQLKVKFDDENAVSN
eukprot:CAMPEP_0172483982 /NCGR_PEP_ID=MMETSP1066-20121228/11230_1 /TAXON_ID=671091 /ORGANISM="Coscinodiscus wailesii, Strain CCMP2513" /LENGTH=454 /DNA_ID=CAMNT_0013248207 /DNA_START=221 /DNA_END=1585 /DNA_ORIENTATION=+